MSIIMDTNPHKPLVSVIMAAYNAEKYIGEAIESVRAQTFTDWELVIADDASTDSTGRIADEYARKEPRMRVIRLSKNSGQAIARNEAVKIARGKFLAILDADDIALPGRLEKQAAFLESRPDMAIAGSGAILIDASGKQIGSKSKPLESARIAFKLILQTQFIHSSVMMRKEAFDKLGGYDTEYLYAEDYDLWCRMADAGLKLANLSEPLIKFRLQTGVSIIASKTQKEQEERAYGINDRNAGKYFDWRRPRVKRLVDFVNSRKQALNEKLAALRDYRRLTSEYCRRNALNKPDKELVWKDFKAERWNLFASTVKGPLKRFSLRRHKRREMPRISAI